MSLVKIFVYLNDSNHITINNTLMSKNIISFDIEYNSARKELTQIAYLRSCDPEPHFFNGNQVEKGRRDFIAALNEADVLVGHNIKEWDLSILNIEIGSRTFIWDTLEVEQLLNTVRGSYSLVTSHTAAEDASKAYELFRDQIYRISKNEGLRNRLIPYFKLEKQFLVELEEYKKEGAGFFMDEISCNEDLVEQINNHIAENPGKTTRLICPRAFWKELSLCRNDIVFKYYSRSRDNADFPYKEIDPNKLESSESFNEKEKSLMKYFLEDCAKSRCAPILVNLPYGLFKNQFSENRGPLLNITKNSDDANIVCVDPNDVKTDVSGKYADIELYTEYNQLFALSEDANQKNEDVISIKAEFNCIKGPGSLTDDIIRFLKKNKKPVVAVYEKNKMESVKESLCTLNDRGVYVPQHDRKLSLVKCLDLICRHHSDSCGSIMFIRDEDLLHLCRTRFPEDISFLFLSWSVFGCKAALYKNNNLELVLGLHKKVLRTISSNTTEQFYSGYPFDTELNELVENTDASESIRKKFLGPEGKWFTEKDGGYNQGEYLNNILKSGDGEVKNYFITIPTGGGKSVLFQGPAIYKFAKDKKLSIVVTPLKQLMQDQYEGLCRKGFAKYAGYINGDLDINERNNIINRIEQGEIGLLYIAPEQILSGQLFGKLENRFKKDGGFGYIIFDEAHCISLWGGDFRPRYKLGTMKIMNYIKNSCPSLFFSATLPELTKKEIKSLVGKKIDKIGSGSQSISNKTLEIKPYKNTDENNQFIKFEDLTPIISESVREYLQEIIIKGFNKEESRVLIFYDYKSGAEEITKNLNDSLPSESPFKGCIGYFHADLDSDTKNEVVEKFRNGDLLAVITTKAFGMGIDLPNIHYVLHVKIPQSIEDYVQEIGRAGRNLTSLKKADLDEAQICCLLRTTQMSVNRRNPIADRIELALDILRGKFGNIEDGEEKHYFELPLVFYENGKKIGKDEAMSIIDHIMCELQLLGRIEFIRDAKSVISIKINRNNILSDDAGQDEDCTKVLETISECFVTRGVQESDVTSVRERNVVCTEFEELDYESLLPAVDSSLERLETALSKLSVGKAITLDKELSFSFKDVKKELEYCKNEGIKPLCPEVFKSAIKKILSRNTVAEKEIIGIIHECLSAVLPGLGESEEKMPWGSGKVGDYTKNISNVVTKFLRQKNWLEEKAEETKSNENIFSVSHSNDSEKIVESLVRSCNKLIEILYSKQTHPRDKFYIKLSEIIELSENENENENISFTEFLQAKMLLTSLGYISEHINVASLVKVIKTSPLSDEEKHRYEDRDAILNDKAGLLEKMLRIQFNKKDEYDIFKKFEEYINIENDSKLQKFIEEVNEANPEELNKT